VNAKGKGALDACRAHVGHRVLLNQEGHRVGSLDDAKGCAHAVGQAQPLIEEGRQAGGVRRAKPGHEPRSHSGRDTRDSQRRLDAPHQPREGDERSRRRGHAQRQRPE
jgi:hypothetical protein